MKTDFQDSTATLPPAAPNGTHRAAKKSAPESKRSAGSHTPHSAPAEPLAAPFAASDPTPIDAEMWPLHTAMWFQPERAPSVSQWSGLAVERRNRLPAPAFAHPAAAQLDRPGAPELARDARTPDARPAIPRSDLAPLGWDPRAVCRREERE
jgi:hypothetical protein